MTSRDSVAVVVGALIGAALRWGAGEVLGARPGLLVVNVIGCAVMGWAITCAAARPWLTAGWCGALTSYSALAVDTARTLDAGEWVTAVGWLLATTGLAALAFGVGRQMAQLP